MIKITEKHTATKKFILYSGHDESIHCLILLITNERVPVPFGSQIIFELVSKSAG